eukprot:3123925-Amphidinium_carterae.1
MPCYVLTPMHTYTVGPDSKPQLVRSVNMQPLFGWRQQHRPHKPRAHLPCYSQASKERQRRDCHCVLICSIVDVLIVRNDATSKTGARTVSTMCTIEYGQ